MNSAHGKAWVRGGSIVLLLVCWAGCPFFICGCKEASKVSFVPRRTEIPGYRTAVPFELTKNMPLVEVSVDGRGPYWFVLDTGSSTLMLSHELAAQINAPSIPVEAILATPAGKVSLGYVRHIKSVEVGAAGFRDVSAGVLDLAGIRKSVSAEVQGVLGLNIFANCRFTIDYPARQIVLETSAKAELLSPDEDNVVPLRPLSDDLVAVPIVVNKNTYWCMLDSGHASGIVVPNEMAAALPLMAPPVRVPTSTMTFRGKLPNRKARLKGSATLGPHELVRPITLFQAGAPKIGGEVLKHFVVTIDQQAMVARFVQAVEGPIATPPSIRHHGFFYERESEGWIITGPIEGVTLDQLGLEVDDRVMMVDNTPTSELSDEQLKALVANSNTLTLSVLRGKDQLSASIPVTVLVP